MKITEILEERNMMNFDDLSPMQVSILKRIYTGKMDTENASEKAHQSMDELVDLGLLDAGYGLTSTGEKMAMLGKRLGSLDKRRAQQASSIDNKRTGVFGSPSEI